MKGKHKVAAGIGAALSLGLVYINPIGADTSNRNIFCNNVVRVYQVDIFGVENSGSHLVTLDDSGVLYGQEWLFRAISSSAEIQITLLSSWQSDDPECYNDWDGGRRYRNDSD